MFARCTISNLLNQDEDEVVNKKIKIEDLRLAGANGEKSLPRAYNNWFIRFTDSAQRLEEVQ